MLRKVATLPDVMPTILNRVFRAPARLQPTGV
jgi:hypothetical protein